MDKLDKLLYDCPVTKVYLEAIDGTSFCIYKGDGFCKYRRARSSAEGAGFYCVFENEKLFFEKLKELYSK